MNNDRLAAILNLDELNFFKMHPLLKPYNLFYSNGVDILSGFQNIPQYQACRGELWLIAAILNFINLKFFKMHPLLKPYNLFDINEIAILSGFHDIPQYQACRGE